MILAGAEVGPVTSTSAGSGVFQKSEEHLLPSLFELVCRDRLDGGLQASFHDIIVAFTKNPTKPWTRFINDYGDELFVVFHAFLHTKFLFQYESSFGDNFYAMKRVKCVRSQNGSLLQSIRWMISTIISGRTPKPSAAATAAATTTTAGVASAAMASAIPSVTGMAEAYFFRRLNAKERVFALLFLLFIPYFEFKLESRYKRLLDMNDMERDLYFSSADAALAELNAARNEESDECTEGKVVVNDSEKTDSTKTKTETKMDTLTYLRKLWSDYYSVKLDALLWRWYPTMDSAMHGVSLVLKLCYLFGFSHFDNAANWCLGQCTQRIEFKDLSHWRQGKQAFVSTKNMSSAQWRVASLRRKLRYYFWRLTYALGDFSRAATLCVIFGFKWVQWLISEETQLMANSRTAMPIPRPPPPVPVTLDKETLLRNTGLPLEAAVKAAKQLIDKSKSEGLCPVCHKKRSNSAALPSGYVFCYSCVFPFVRENGFCPVTQMPCHTLQIRRIFEE